MGANWRMLAAPHAMNCTRSSLALSLLLLLSALPAGRAQEWTRFRGPNGSGVGVAPNLPAVFSETDYDWNVELPGSGSFVASHLGKSRFPHRHADRHGQAGDPLPRRQRMATRSGSKVCARRTFNSTRTIATRACRRRWMRSAFTFGGVRRRVPRLWRSIRKTGEKCGGATLVLRLAAWARRLADRGGRSGASEFRPGSTPSFLLAVDAKTGKERWKYSMPARPPPSSTPCLYENPDGRTEAILISRTVGMTASMWRQASPLGSSRSCLPKRCVASPIVTFRHRVIGQCGEGQAESFVYAVQPGGSRHAATKTLRSRPHRRLCAEPAGGRRPALSLERKWPRDLPACGDQRTDLERARRRPLSTVRPSPSVVGYTISPGAAISSFSPRARSFERSARIPLGEGSFATPAVSDGRMYLRTFTHLISVGK